MKYTLAKQNYKKETFLKIFEFAIQTKQLDEKQILSIQNDIFEIVKVLTLTYTKKRSTTITAKKFKQFMKSIYYVLDHLIVKYQDPVFELKNSNIKGLYENGIIILNELYDLLEEQIKKLKSIRIITNNERYNDIFDRQLPYFMALYDIDYRAYYCGYDLDYPLIDGIPLYFDMYHLEGIDLVLEYTKRLMIEHTFCTYFEEKDKVTLFAAYELQKGITMEFIGINFLEVILMQVLFNMLLDKQELSIIVNKEEALYIQKMIYQKDIKTIIELMYKKLSTKIHERSMYQYLCKFREDFTRRLEIGKEKDSITDLIVFFDGSKEIIHFKEPVLSDSEYYMTVIESVQRNNDVLERIFIILNSKLSLYDYIDLLDANILSRKDYQCFFHQIDIHSIALLLKKTYPEEFLFNQNVFLDKQFVQRLEKDKQWKEVFCEVLLEFTSQKKTEITSIIRKML